MALIKCKECGKEISSEAPTCPGCGNPQKAVPQKSSSVFGIVLKVLISLFVILVIAPLVICGGVFQQVGTNTIKRFEEAKKEETKIQIRNLESALKLFKLDNGFYPETQQGLAALITKPTTGKQPCCYPPGGYMEGASIPKDGWKQEFVYTSDGNQYRLYSKGPDGK